MLRCRTHGIYTPAVYYVDLYNSKIYMENMVNSRTVKDYICGVQAQATHHPAPHDDPLLKLAQKIGSILGKMHARNIIHGDLTTSNFLLVGSPEDFCVCLIDFGLGSLEGSAEDKGVDLYVLERALLSTHPSTQHVFEEILRSYATSYKATGDSGKGLTEVIQKLEEVRMRGRKRTMVG